MQVAVNKAWCQTCKIKSPTRLVWSETLDPIFDLLKVDDFGSRGKMYTVQLEYGTWVVWSIRGVLELEDEVK